MYEFTYNASALGLGGVIEKGGCTTIIPSLASVALAPTGGEGSAVVENYCRDGISFSRAESRVYGYKTGPKLYTTISDIFITNLSVFGQLKVALLSGTVTSTRHLDEPDSRFELRAMYRGVEADGEETIPAIDVDICSCPTYEEFVGKIRSNVPQFAAQFGVSETKLADAVGIGPDEAGLLRREINPPRDVIRGSIVNAVHRSNRSLTAQGNKLTIPGLGSVRFGELLVKKGRRRVNLLRFEFGPEESNEESHDFGGSLTVASGDGNGSPVWPNG